MTGPRIKYADKLSNGKGAGRLAEVDIMLSDGEHLGLDYMHITRRRYIPRGKPGGERIELVIVDDTVTIRVREGQKFDLYSLYDQINRKQLATLEPGKCWRSNAPTCSSRCYSPHRKPHARSAAAMDTASRICRSLGGWMSLPRR